MVVYLAGGAFVLIGIVMLAFPGFVRSLEELANDMKGVSTHQGEAYKIGVELRALMLIGGGIVIMLLPAIVN